MKINKKFLTIVLSLAMFVLGYAVHAYLPIYTAQANPASASFVDPIERIANSLSKMEGMGYDIDQMATSMKNAADSIDDAADSLDDIYGAVRNLK